MPPAVSSGCGSGGKAERPPPPPPPPPPPATAPQPLDDLGAEVRDVDHPLATAGGGEPLQVPGDERLAPGFDQGLGNAVGERPQTLASARGENHRFHANSSSSRPSGASAA